MQAAATLNEQEATKAFTAISERGIAKETIAELEALQERTTQYGHTYWQIKDKIAEFKKEMQDDGTVAAGKYKRRDYEERNRDQIKQENYEAAQRQFARDKELLERVKKENAERAKLEADAANNTAINDPDSDFEFDDDTESPAKNPDAPLPLKGADVSGLDQAVKMQALEGQLDPSMKKHLGQQLAVRPDLNKQGSMIIHPVGTRGGVKYGRTLGDYSGPLVLKNASPHFNPKEKVASIRGTVQNRIPRGYKKGPEIKYDPKVDYRMRVAESGQEFTKAQYVVQEGNKTYMVVKDPKKPDCL